MSKLTASLPAGFTQDKQEFVQRLRAAEHDFAGPPGKVVAEYTLSGKNDEPERFFQIYECALESNTGAQKLHANMQTVALWFIEGIALRSKFYL